MLNGAAHQVVGLGDCLYHSCTFRHGMVEVPGCHGRARCRGARRKRLKPGMRLAGLSTRPLDDLNPEISFVDRGARS